MAVDLMPLYLAGLWCMVAKPDASASEPGTRWPLLLFLHGSGERGPPDGQSLHLVANHGPWKAPSLNKFMVVAPQCPSGLTWCGLAEKVAALTRALFRRCKQLDPTRCVLSGFSMGAFGCWSVMSAAPGLFGCVLAVCGGWAPALPRDTALSTVVARAKQKLTLREAREVSGAARWKRKCSLPMEKKNRLDADLWTGTFAHTGLKSNASNIHLLNKSGWGYSSK